MRGDHGTRAERRAAQTDAAATERADGNTRGRSMGGDHNVTEATTTKKTAKALALEARWPMRVTRPGRPEGARPVVLRALLTAAALALDAVEELKRPRKVKAEKETGA